MKTAFLLGRLVFGGFFVYSGIHHFQEKKSMSQYAAAKSVPMAELAVTATGTAMIAGGASIVLGTKPKLGALMLVAVLAGISPVMHNFWDVQEPGQKQNDMINFMKNVAMLGAALALMGVEEPWPASLPIGQPTTFDRVRRAVRQVAS